VRFRAPFTAIHAYIHTIHTHAIHAYNYFCILTYSYIHAATLRTFIHTYIYMYSCNTCIHLVPLYIHVTYKVKNVMTVIKYHVNVIFKNKEQRDGLQ
jgi:hypothetical protein